METTPRLLVVADWTVVAQSVVTAARRAAESRRQPLALLVPAWLHGIDWVGDPLASRPCAERQLGAILELAESAGLRFELAVVGDPDPVTAIEDAVSAWPADELLLCTRRRRAGLGHPLLGARTERATG